MRASRWSQAVTYAGVALLILSSLLPVVYMILTSLKPDRLLLADPPRFLFTPVLDNYVKLLVAGNFAQYYRNSFIVAVGATGIGVLVGTMMAFAFERVPFRGKPFAFFLILVPRSFPPVTTIIPVFFVVRAFGMIDQVSTLILFEAAVRLPLVVWLMRGFLRRVPDELIEAAMIDGCGLMRTFFQIVLPLSLPGIAAVTILSFIDTWNAFLVPLILTNLKAITAPVAIISYMEADQQLQWGIVAAGGTLTILPILVIAALLRRYLVQGLTDGAVK